MKIRRATRSLVSILTSLMSLLMMPHVASADVPQANTFLSLVNVGSGKCLEPAVGAPAPFSAPYSLGLPIQQRTCLHGPEEDTPRWWWYSDLPEYEFVPLGFVAFNKGKPWYCPTCPDAGAEGYFIKNRVSRQCLDARDGAKTNGSVVQQWECRDKRARSMVWYVQPGDLPDTLKIRNFNSDLCLDVRGGSSDEFAQLQQYRCTSNNFAQNFWQMSARSIAIALNGNWRASTVSTTSAHIYAGPKSIMIDMSDYGRPKANGSILPNEAFSVTFPDDRTYEGHFALGTIYWSNGSVWMKEPLSRMEYDTDRPGSDYYSYQTSQSSPRLGGAQRDAEECRWICVADHKCEAWTFVRPGVQDINAHCYLKRPAPAPVQNTCCISGTVAR